MTLILAGAYLTASMSLFVFVRDLFPIGLGSPFVVTLSFSLVTLILLTFSGLVGDLRYLTPARFLLPLSCAFAFHSASGTSALSPLSLACLAWAVRCTIKWLPPRYLCAEPTDPFHLTTIDVALAVTRMVTVAVACMAVAEAAVNADGVALSQAPPSYAQVLPLLLALLALSVRSFYFAEWLFWLSVVASLCQGKAGATVSAAGMAWRCLAPVPMMLLFPLFDPVPAVQHQEAQQKEKSKKE
jgi:hypothetical protein